MATSENPKRSELFRFSGAGQLAEAIEREWPKLPVILATGFAELPADVPSLARMAKPFTQRTSPRRWSVFIQNQERRALRSLPHPVRKPDATKIKRRKAGKSFGTRGTAPASVKRSPNKAGGTTA